MKRTVWKFFQDFEKEETWLNEMSSNGLALIDRFGFHYEFADCNPGEYVYRTESLKKRPGSRESQNYLNFVIDSGIEHVLTYGYLVYFRRRANEGPFEIYTDIESKLSYYKRISKYWLPLICMMALLSVEHAYLGIDNYLMTKELMELIPDLELTLWWPLYIIYSIVFFGLMVAFIRPWNNLRKKVKRLKEEKNTRV